MFKKTQLFILRSDLTPNTQNYRSTGDRESCTEHQLSCVNLKPAYLQTLVMVVSEEGCHHFFRPHYTPNTQNYRSTGDRETCHKTSVELCKLKTSLQTLVMVVSKEGCHHFLRPDSTPNTQNYRSTGDSETCHKTSVDLRHVETHLKIFVMIITFYMSRRGNH